jgi:hypothetical protein
MRQAWIYLPSTKLKPPPCDRLLHTREVPGSILDVGGSLVLFGGSRGITYVVTKPYYVAAAQDRRILATATELLAQNLTALSGFGVNGF